MIEIICGFKVRAQGKTYKIVCDNMSDVLNVITQETDIKISDIESINPWHDEIYVANSIRKKEKHVVRA